MTPMSERYTAGVTVILTPAARRIGALVRARDLDKAGLLTPIDQQQRAR